MAPAKKNTPAPAETPKSVVSANQWQNLLEQLNQKGGDLLFLKPGKTRVKLLLQENQDPQNFFEQTTRFWQGQPRTRYLVWCTVMPDPKSKEENPNAGQARALLLNKTTLSDIIQLLAEGYDLFDQEEGHGLVINKVGEKLETSYTVMPSQRPVVVKNEDLEWPTMKTEEDGEVEKTLADIAEEFAKDSRRRDEEGNKKESVTFTPNRGKGKKEVSLDEFDSDGEDDISF